MKARVKYEDSHGWIPWSERKPKKRTKVIVIVLDGTVGFHLVFMGTMETISISKVEEAWGYRMKDMYWIGLPIFFKSKEPEHKNINWEQRRYELAKAAMQGLLNATSVERFTLRIKPSSIAEASLEYADELIKKLKKNNKKSEI